MKIGHLKNETLIKDYKLFGFTTRAQLIDTALDLLREKLESDARLKWKQDAFKNYIETGKENLWEEIDAEDISIDPNTLKNM